MAALLSFISLSCVSSPPRVCLNTQRLVAPWFWYVWEERQEGVDINRGVCGPRVPKEICTKASPGPHPTQPQIPNSKFHALKIFQFPNYPQPTSSIFPDTSSSSPTFMWASTTEKIGRPFIKKKRKKENPQKFLSFLDIWAIWHASVPPDPELLNISWQNFVVPLSCLLTACCTRKTSIIVGIDQINK